MLIRGWNLDRLLENEAEAVGEDAAAGAAVEAAESPASEVASSESTASDDDQSGGVNHDENVAIVAEYFSELKSTGTEKDTSASATTSEPVKANPVETTSTDAAATRSDAGSGAEGGEKLDPVLVDVAKSYGLQDDELSGMSTDELVRFTKLMERRWEASESEALRRAQEQAGAEGANGASAETQASADAFQRHLDALRERGVDVDNDEILTTVKVQYDALLDHIQRIEQSHQQQSVQFQQYLDQVNHKRVADAVLSGVVHKLGRTDLFGDGLRPTREQAQNFQQTLAEFHAVAARHPNESFDYLLHRALVRSHGDKLAHKAATDYATKVLKQSQSVMGSTMAAKPSSETHWTGSIDEHPKVNRVWERMQRNRT